MNKLVSRSPILRFKLGKKIEKFENGGRKSSNEKWTEFWGNIFDNWNWSTGILGNNTSSKDYSSMTKGSNQLKDYIPLGGVLAMRLKYLGKSNMDVAKEETHNYLEKLRNKYIRPFQKSSMTEPLIITKFKKPYILSKYTDIMSKRGITPDLIIEWLNKLKDYYDPNAKYKSADGIWGHDTEVAYNNYMNNGGAGLPTSLEKESLIQNLALQIGPTLVTLNVLNLTPELTNFTPLRTGTFSKSQIRNLISQGGFDPYKYTGAQRKALRLYLNGESDDTSLLDGTDLARFTLPFRKLGGRLISRNPIKRFKLNKK